MKPLLIATALFTAAAAFAPEAHAAPNQGQLTAFEARDLRADTQALNAAHARAARDGRITPAERRQLSKMASQLNKEKQVYFNNRKRR
jgi:tellurite resistance protein